MDQVIFPLPVIDDIRRPKATEFLFPEFQQGLLRPIDQILRFPHRKALAAAVGNAVPIVKMLFPIAVSQTQICGQNAVFPVRKRQYTKRAEPL